MRKLLLSLLCLITLGTFAVSAQTAIEGYTTTSFAFDFSKISGPISDEISLTVPEVDFDLSDFERTGDSGNLVAGFEASGEAMISNSAPIDLPVCKFNINIAKIQGVNSIKLQYSTVKKFTASKTKTITLTVATGAKSYDLPFEYSAEELADESFDSYYWRIVVDYDDSVEEPIEISSFGFDYYTLASITELTASNFYFQPSTTTATFGTAYTAPVLNKPWTNEADYDGTLKYASEDVTVASVNATTGVVTLKGFGFTTITVTASGSSKYTDAKASYVLNVLPNAVKIVSEEDLPGTTADVYGVLDAKSMGVTGTALVEHAYDGVCSDYIFIGGADADGNLVVSTQQSADCSFVINSHPNFDIMAIAVNYDAGSSLKLIAAQEGKLEAGAALASMSATTTLTAKRTYFKFSKGQSAVALYPTSNTPTKIQSVYVLYKPVEISIDANSLEVFDADKHPIDNNGKLGLNQEYTLEYTNHEPEIVYFTGNINSTEYENEPLPITFSATPEDENNEVLIDGTLSAPYYPTTDHISRYYTIDIPQTPTPTFSVASGQYRTVQFVEIACSDANATIYYVTGENAETDAEAIKEKGQVYSSPIEVDDTKVISAVAINEVDNYTISKVASVSIEIVVSNDAQISFSDQSTLYQVVNTNKTAVLENGVSVKYVDSQVSKFTAVTSGSKSVANVNFASDHSNASVSFSAANLYPTRLYVTGGRITFQAYRSKGSDAWANPNYITKIVITGTQLRDLEFSSASKVTRTLVRYPIGTNPDPDFYNDDYEGFDGNGIPKEYKENTTTLNKSNVIVTKDSNTQYTITCPTGLSNLVLTVGNTNNITGVSFEQENNTTGVEEVSNDEFDENAPVEYYNLQGLRLNGDNLPAGFVIKKQGNKVTKLLVH